MTFSYTKYKLSVRMLLTRLIWSFTGMILLNERGWITESSKLKLIGKVLLELQVSK